jgi:hypothetical protein
MPTDRHTVALINVFCKTRSKSIKTKIKNNDWKIQLFIYPKVIRLVESNISKNNTGTKFIRVQYCNLIIIFLKYQWHCKKTVMWGNMLDFPLLVISETLWSREKTFYCLYLYCSISNAHIRSLISGCHKRVCIIYVLYWLYLLSWSWH